jgi:opacity protein-like surface antigen
MNASQTVLSRRTLLMSRAAILALVCGGVAPAALAQDAPSPASTELRAGSLALESQPEPATNGATSEAAAAAAPASPLADQPAKWTVRIEPKLWFAAPSGKLRLPGASGGTPPVLVRGDDPPPMSTDSGRVRLDSLDTDRTRLSPAGDVRIGAGDWLFSFSGANYEISLDSVTADEPFRFAGVDLAAGDVFSIDFEIGLYELSAGYRVWNKDFRTDSSSPSAAANLVMNLYVLGGVRFYDATINFASAGGASSGFDDLFIEPLIGARLETALTEQFGIEVQTSVGYLPGDDKSSFSVDIVAGFYWRPTPNLGVVLGYRQLAYELEDGEDAAKFEYEGRLAGLFTGVEIRF